MTDLADFLEVTPDDARAALADVFDIDGLFLKPATIRRLAVLTDAIDAWEAERRIHAATLGMLEDCQAEAREVEGDGEAA